MAVFDVNNDEVIELSAKLEKLHRSAFPVAVRGTLNDAAFKTKSLVPKIANRRFTIRQKNLFRRFTIVDKASGFDLNKMTASVGIDASVPKGKRVAEGLAVQERGGQVKSRKLLPMNQGRISGSYGKKMRTKNQFSKIDIARGRKRKPSSKHIMIKKGRKGVVFDVSKRGKLTPIYYYRNSNKTQIKKRPFLKPASNLASKKMNSFYLSQAEKQFKRLLK